jgi:glucosylglycerate phosphorylase
VSGRARSINREKFQRAELEAELSKPGSRRQKVFTRYQRLLRLRMEQTAFNPSGEQQVLDLSEAVFATLRSSPERSHQILCLVNVSPLQQEIALDVGELGLSSASEWWDLIGEQEYRVDQGRLSVSLDAYQAVWLASSRVGVISRKSVAAARITRRGSSITPPLRAKLQES